LSYGIRASHQGIKYDALGKPIAAFNKEKEKSAAEPQKGHEAARRKKGE
jgi:hypothetical protein